MDTGLRAAYCACSPEAQPPVSPVSATPSQLQRVRPGGNLPTTFAIGFAVRQVYSFTRERVLVAVQFSKVFARFASTAFAFDVVPLRYIL